MEASKIMKYRSKDGDVINELHMNLLNFLSFYQINSSSLSRLTKGLATISDQVSEGKKGILIGIIYMRVYFVCYLQSIGAVEFGLPIALKGKHKLSDVVLNITGAKLELLSEFYIDNDDVKSAWALIMSISERDLELDEKESNLWLWSIVFIAALFLLGFIVYALILVAGVNDNVNDLVNHRNELHEIVRRGVNTGNVDPKINKKESVNLNNDQSESKLMKIDGEVLRHLEIKLPEIPDIDPSKIGDDIASSVRIIFDGVMRALWFLQDISILLLVIFVLFMTEIIMIYIKRFYKFYKVSVGFFRKTKFKGVNFRGLSKNRSRED